MLTAHPGSARCAQSLKRHGDAAVSAVMSGKRRARSEEVTLESRGWLKPGVSASMPPPGSWMSVTDVVVHLAHADKIKPAASLGSAAAATVQRAAAAIHIARFVLAVHCLVVARRVGASRGRHTQRAPNAWQAQRSLVRAVPPEAQRVDEARLAGAAGAGDDRCPAAERARCIQQTQARLAAQQHRFVAPRAKLWGAREHGRVGMSAGCKRARARARARARTHAHTPTHPHTRTHTPTHPHTQFTSTRGHMLRACARACLPARVPLCCQYRWAGWRPVGIFPEHIA
eukprot:357700-Chlamydomonas_euryale.AAC.6